MLNKKSDLPRGSKKLIRAWTFYDWANSVYSLVISSAIFPIYYSTHVFSDINSILIFNLDINKDTLISLLSGLCFLIIAFLSPMLSGIADYIGNKKIFMKFFVYMGSFSCMSLYWFELEKMQVLNLEGQHLGNVDRVDNFGANDVLKVQKKNKTLLIPFIKNRVIISINKKENSILVDWQEDY